MFRAHPVVALVVGLVLCAAAHAGEVVATLSANGTIRIGPDGKVLSHRIDERVPEQVAAAISRNVAAWTFEPILEEGRPVIAETPMHLTIEAIEHSADELALRLAYVWFGEQAIALDSKAPVYPEAAIPYRVGARVMLALRLDEEGRVVKAHAYQTSFPKGVGERLAKRLRRDFERASVRAAKEWRYGPEFSQPGGTTLYTAIVYTLSELGADVAHWQMFVPGEIVPAPWVADDGAAAAPLTPDGTARITDARIRLTRDPAGTLL